MQGLRIGMNRFVGIVKFYQAIANLMIEKTDFAGRERNRGVLETLGEICERGFIVLLDIGTARLLNRSLFIVKPY